MSVGKMNWRYNISFQGGFRDWDWKASHMEPDGRVLMPAGLLHSQDCHVADEEGYVDLTPFKGRPIRMRKRGVLRILHLHEMAWPLFERCHWVPREIDGSDTWYHFDPETSFASIYKWWAFLVKEPRTHEQFADCRSFLKLANPPSEVLPPRPIIRGAVRGLGRPPSHRSHLSAYMTVRVDQQKALLAAAREEALLIADRDPIFLPQRDQPARSGLPAVAVSEEDLVSRVPFLKGLAHSCFDPENDPENPTYLPPDATSRSRLAKVRHGFVPAAFFTYQKAPVMRQPDVLPRYIRSYDRFIQEAVAENSEFDVANEADIDRAFEHVACGDLAKLVIGRPARDRMIQDAASVLRHSRRVMLAFDPDGTKGIAHLAPAEQTDRAGFLKRMKDLYGSDRETYGASRQLYANRVKNAYEQTLDVAAFRIEQLLQDGNAMRAGIDILCGADSADLAYFDVYGAGRELSEKGRPTGRMQMRHYRIWRLDDAWRSLEYDRPWHSEPSPEVWRSHVAESAEPRTSIRNSPLAGSRTRRPEFHGSEFVCEYLETHGSEPKVASIEPFAVTLAKHYAFNDGGGYLDVVQRGEKEALRRRWRLPGSTSGTHGLLKFDGERSRLARTASQSTRQCRRVFVPMEEAEHAMRLAGHGVDAVAQTWCRQSEFIQQADYANFWENDEDPDAYGWWASTKLSRSKPIWEIQFLECDEDHYLNGRALSELQCRRCRIDELPLVDPPRRLAYKLEPAPFILSFNGKMVSFKDLTSYLRLLYANVGDFRFHDLRAGASNRARRKGTPLIAIGEGLAHRTAEYIELYSQLTAEQSDEQKHDIRRTKRQRIEEDRNREDYA